MSLALATKGMIAGIGTGTGGGLYPSDYIASTVEVDVDTSEISVSIESESIELTIETYEED
jgi:hypothetical protein